VPVGVFHLYRNGSRRRCYMSECGNRAKIRAWPARMEGER
jgi:predicted RNA-binding Zn ribbon-like protein